MAGVKSTGFASSLTAAYFGIRRVVSGLGKPALSGRFRSFKTFTESVRDSPGLSCLTILKVVDNIGASLARSASNTRKQPLAGIAQRLRYSEVPLAFIFRLRDRVGDLIGRPLSTPGCAARTGKIEQPPRWPTLATQTVNHALTAFV
jgi:hypothetical protein